LWREKAAPAASTRRAKNTNNDLKENTYDLYTTISIDEWLLFHKNTIILLATIAPGSSSARLLRSAAEASKLSILFRFLRVIGYGQIEQ
jgi:hypothetical protein